MILSATLLLGLLAAPARAQTIGAGSYPFAASSGAALEDMSGGTSPLVGPNVDDTASGVAAIGFEFWFVGTRYNQFSANANGLMRLGPTAVGAAFANDLASGTNAPQIAPYWDDLYTGTNGRVHYKVVGVAPSRKLVVEWQNMQVPRAGAGNSGAATFQCWLHETSGRIEFVYDGGMASNFTNGGASVGFGSSASVFASVTVTGPAVSYAAASNGNSAAIASGTKYAFTPPVPAAPTGLAFTGVGALGMTLQWTDAATNETGYAVYRSTDGASYEFVAPLAAGSTSYAASGLAPSTTYYWRVHANSEGALSAALEGSQATAAAGTITTAGSGNWSSTVPGAPWPGGAIPTSTDDVTIADGHTVTVEAAATCYGLAVGQGASGVLQFEATSARTLTAGGSVVIAPGATLRSALTGTQAGHVLSVGGSLTNSGTLDLSTNGDSAGAGLAFTGASAASFSGAGAVTDLSTLTVSRGTGTVLTLSADALTVRGTAAGAPAFLTLTAGTLRISGSFAMSGPLFADPEYNIGAAAGLWLDNANFAVTAQGGSPIVSGLLRVSAGTLAVGTAAGDALQLGNGSVATLEGGAVHVAGRFSVNSAASRVTYTQSGGTLTVCTVGQSSTTFASFDLGTATTSAVTISGGSIVVQNASAAATGPRDYRNRGGIQDVTGGMLRLGNASTPAADTFYVNGTAPGLHVTNLPAGHTAQLAGATTAGGSSLVDSTATLNLAGFRFTQSLGNLVNHGTITGGAAGSELYFLGTSSPQTYSGTGVVTAPLGGSGLTVDNPAGVTIDAGIPQNLATRRVNLVRGVLANSHKITLGGASLSAATQIGATGLAATGGAYDIYPTLHPGIGNYSVHYFQEGTARSTGYEIPATKGVDTLTVNNTNGLTVTLDTLRVLRSLSLTAGLLNTTGTNRLLLASTITSPPAGSAASYVNGPLGIEINSGSATNRTFAIGASGAFRPLILKSVNTGGVSRVFTSEVIPGATGGTPVSPLLALAGTRYWRVANSANLNAAVRINLAFGTDDNVGTLANLRVAQSGTSGGSYANLGGTATGGMSSGTVESTVNQTPGSDYFAIGSTGQLASAWDGGAGTGNWGDAANWSPDAVPTSSTNVSLALAAPDTLDVNGTFSVSNLTVGDNVTLTVGTGSLTVTGAYLQQAGAVSATGGALSITGTTSLSGGVLGAGAGTVTATGAATVSGGTLALSGTGLFLASGSLTLSGGAISLGTGTLEMRGAFTRTGGNFVADAGKTIFSGTSAQNINAAASYYDLILRNGGAGQPKRFTSAISFVVNNDWTVESTAQVALSTGDQTDLVLWGSLYYSGISGGANVGDLVLHLRGMGKTIAGVPSAGAAQSRPAAFQERAQALLSASPVLQVDWRTDPSTAVRLDATAGGKPLLLLENTYQKRKGAVDSLLASADPAALLVINLDDRTITRNPAALGELFSAESGGGELATATSTLPMHMFVEDGGTYSLGGNVTMGSGRTLYVISRLDCGAFTVGGAGEIYVAGFATLGTAAGSGLGATVVTTGSNTYDDGAIIEYNAAGNQTVNAASHPASAMIHAVGGGTKTLSADKTITGTSGTQLTQGALLVGPGTTFADGGHSISFTTPQFANVIVNGAYQSSGSGSISYQSGPFGSSLQASDGTVFGDLLVNFDDSSSSVDLNASSTVGLTFRNLVFGGTAGPGTGGGMLRLNETGTTNVTVTGNVTIAPLDNAKSGGGFGGTSGKNGQVTLLGNLTSASLAATQPIMNGTGTNRLVLAGAARETLALAASATTFTGATLEVGSAGLHLGGSGVTCTIGPGGTLALGSGNASTGSCTLAVEAGGTLTRTTGRVVGPLRKGIAAGPASATFEIGSETDDFPVSVAFGSVSAPGSVTATSAAGDHPDLAASGIYPARSVNRTYRLVNEGVGFDTCAVAVTYPAADVDPGADPDSFFVRKYLAPTWSPTGAGARTPTSTQGTGITSFSEFAVGEVPWFTLAGSATAGGTLSPSGSVVVPHATTQAFSITPDAGHHIVNVLVDGDSLGPVTSHTFANVTADHTIAASFAPDTFTITASAGPHGTVTPAGVSTFPYGSDVVYAITPDAGYEVVNVWVDGDSVGPVTSYAFDAIAASHTISATFLLVFQVSASSPPAVISGANACVTVPVQLNRVNSLPLRGFSVTFSLSPNLELCSGTSSITEGTFLSASGATTFYVRSLGAGAYVADGVILGAACGPTALTGNLFNLAVKSAVASDTGTVTLGTIKLRDCDNQVLFVATGAPARVAIDNQPPVVSLTFPDGGEVLTIDSTHVITWSTTDNAGPATVDLAYSTDGGASFPDTIAFTVPDSGSHAWTVPGPYSTTARVRITARDVNGNTASDSSAADFEIRETNVAPLLAAIGDRTVDEGDTLGFTAAAGDGNLPAQALTFTLDAGAPAGAAIDSSTGAFSWSPGEAQGPGDYPVTVRVTDAGTPPLDDSETFSIHVDEVNLAPVLAAIGNQTVNEGAALGFTAVATDLDSPGQALTFSLDAGAPAGAIIDDSTGVFAWTPSEAQGPGDYSVTVRVTDNGSPPLDDTETISVHVEEVNMPPLLSGVPTLATIAELVMYSFAAAGTDPDLPAQSLTYSLIGAPAGAGVDSVSGAFAWTPGELQGPGSYPFTVRVTDGMTTTDSSITLIVNESNTPPVLAAIGNQSVDEGALLGFTASATDGDDPPQTLRYSLDAGAPAGAAIDSVSGAFTWTPAEGQGPGDYPLTVIVTDDGTPALADSETISIHVAEVNAPPVLAAIGNQSGNEGALLTFTASATDPDLPAQGLTYVLDAGAPAGAAIDSTTGVFSWTPGEAQGPGDYPVTVVVTDGGSPALADSETISIHVDEVNAAPVLAAIGNQTVSEGALLGFTASATDSDPGPQTLRYSLDGGAPAGAAIDSVSGAFTWTPAEAQGPGDYPVTVVVTDDGIPALADSETISIHVEEVNAAPELAAIGNQSVSEGTLLSFTASATDLDLPAQGLTYSLDAGAPAGAGIDSTTGVFSWTPGEAQGPGDYPLTVIVTDNGTPALADSETISIHVDEVNAGPVLAAIGNKIVTEDSLLSFTASATDLDLPAQSLRYALDTGAPAGAAIDSVSGAFTWTPTVAQGPGDYPVTVVVTDGGVPALADSETISIHVNELNDAPVLAAIGNQSVNEGTLLSFTASATDADVPAQSLVYSLDAGAPAGAGIDSTTGAFTWTPTEAQGPGDYAVTVRVTDNGAPPLDDFETITIHVDEVNVAPVLSGVAAGDTIPELVAHGFTASATDADVPAQALRFSLVGAPAGAAIDSVTGAFSWTPSEAQGPGVYAFTVRVTDGVANTDAGITLTVEDVTVAPIADLSAARLASGNDSDGTAKIALAWSPTGAGTTVEVYRAGYGSYPEYLDGGGQVPATPSYPPGTPWVLTTVAASGQMDEPASRDFHYYVAFVRGEGGNVSAASNRPAGALNYHLGDVSDGITAGQGDNLVNTADVSLLGAHYGLTGSAEVAPFAYLDVGPTTDLSPDALPTTDDILDFEDLVLFAIGYEVVSAPALPAAAGPVAASPAVADELRLAAPARVAAGQEVAARLTLLGSGRVQGLSIRLEWDPAVVRPIAVRAAERFRAEGGVVLSPRPGTLDAALLGVREQALSGEWEVGTVAFEAIGAGEPRIRIADVRARDRANRRVEVSGVGPAPRVIPSVTALARPAPNPFRQSTAFAIGLAQAGRVEVTIHAVDGRRVRTLLEDVREAGEYRLTWDGRDQNGISAAPGMYFVRLTAGARSHTHRIIYVR